MDDTYRALALAVLGHDPVYLWDRLYFSELFYHKYVDRPCQFNEAHQAHIERVLVALECPIILCLPPFEVVKENVKVEDQMDGVNDNIANIWSDYERHYGAGLFPHPNTHVYDYTQTGAYGYVQSLVSGYLHRRKDRTW